jgi:hypothetical protein
MQSVPGILLADHTPAPAMRTQLAYSGFKWILEKPIVVTSLPRLIAETVKRQRLKTHIAHTSALHYINFGSTASQTFMGAISN